MVTGQGVIGLTEALSARLDARTRAEMPVGITPVRLAPEFADRLTSTLQRFNAMAETGIDDEFGRGTKAVEFAFHGPPAPDNRLPNSTLYPLDLEGQLYAISLVGTTFDTDSGPRIGTEGQILGTSGPIVGLYGAGNCVDGVFGEGYPGGGSTIGPGLVFGFLGGAHAGRPFISGREPPVKLAYLDRATGSTGDPVVVLHREGVAPLDEAARMADRLPATGRVILPFGDYAYYPSGMEIGGLCWYRVLPGFEGTDPISLTKAVVQVGDLLDDLDLDHPVLTGSGQGGVVALGAGLLARRAGTSVVCVDAPAAHADLLPAALLAPDPDARILLLAGGPDAGGGLGRMRDLLDAHGIHADTWCWSGDGSRDEGDQAMADHAVEWLQEG